MEWQAFSSYDPFNSLKNQVNEGLSEEELEMDLDEELQVSELVMTPFGLSSIQNLDNPMNKFNFHVGFTDFKITQGHKASLDKNIDGLEGLLILSPYRMLIAVGQMFKTEDVKLQIMKLLCGKKTINLGYFHNPDIERKVRNIIESISSKYWLIYVFPTGKIIQESWDLYNDFLIGKALYSSGNSYSIGALITNEDLK